MLLLGHEKRVLEVYVVYVVYRVVKLLVLLVGALLKVFGHAYTLGFEVLRDLFEHNDVDLICEVAYLARSSVESQLFRDLIHPNVSANASNTFEYDRTSHN